MAGGGGGARGEVSSEPNVVPMIDILLVLLIIFMITQPLSRMAIDVQVPPPEMPSALAAGAIDACGSRSGTRARSATRRPRARARGR